MQQAELERRIAGRLRLRRPGEQLLGLRVLALLNQRAAAQREGARVGLSASSRSTSWILTLVQGTQRFVDDGACLRDCASIGPDDQQRGDDDGDTRKRQEVNVLSPEPDSYCRQYMPTAAPGLPPECAARAASEEDERRAGR